MKWVYNDGGRFASGYKYRVKDCVCRTLSIVTERPYREVQRALKTLDPENPRGRGGYPKYLASLGFQWFPCTGLVHFNDDELLQGRIVVQIKGHIAAVTMHHVYFSGEPAVHMALGAFFSAAEVIPLTILTFEAWSFVQLGAQQEAKSQSPFPHFWAVMFLASVGFWNFLGAGIFGFLINLPIVSYYEIGTTLTANHAHASMMGIYGMLSVGLALFCQRYMIPESRWSDRAAKNSFWSLNLGLAWMVFATLFPLGSPAVVPFRERWLF